MENNDSKKNRTRWEQLFRAAVWLLIVAVFLFVIWKIYVFYQKHKTENEMLALQAQQQVLSEYESAKEYDKFLAVKDLEDKTVDMPWFQHIPKILQIFQDLRDVDSDPNNMVVLSDFNVSLEEISLKWSVSSLRALYFSSDTWAIKSLLDKFEELDFIRDMKIKSYEKIGGRYFEFILNANVVLQDE